MCYYLKNSISRRGRAIRTGTKYLGNGILASEGELHRHQEELIGPAFQRIQPRYLRIISQSAENTCASWSDGDQIDVYHSMRALALDVIAQTMFGIKLGDKIEPIGEAVSAIFGSFNPATQVLAEPRYKITNSERKLLLGPRHQKVPQS